MFQSKKYQLILRHKTFIWTAIVSALIAINFAGYLGAYALTNYRLKNVLRLGYPRPENNKTPVDFALYYQSDLITINQQEWIETWHIKSPDHQPKGTVILFHGKDNTKSSLLASAQVFYSLGYDSLLVDFRGVGNSSGNVTTVGVKEAQDVAIVIANIQQSKPNHPIILYGI